MNFRFKAGILISQIGWWHTLVTLTDEGVQSLSKAMKAAYEETLKIS